MAKICPQCGMEVEEDEYNSDLDACWDCVDESDQIQDDKNNSSCYSITY